jgi:hypothetical protein
MTLDTARAAPMSRFVSAPWKESAHVLDHLTFGVASALGWEQWRSDET